MSSGAGLVLQLVILHKMCKLGIKIKTVREESRSVKPRPLPDPRTLFVDWEEVLENEHNEPKAGVLLL